MKIDIKQFQIMENQTVELKKHPTIIDPFYESKDDYKNILESHIEKMNSLQSILYADNRYALLLIFQAMDAAGKDGAIKHVMSGVNPQGCQVYSYKHPSPQELEHDFLWRTTRDLPQRGQIGIFNRSYYEEVLVVRVHPEILKGENIPENLMNTKNIWEHRYRSINGLEQHLTCNGTKIIKFYLHLSKEEQRNRFLKRIEDPTKNWKLSQADLQERKFWDKYMNAYEDCISATSTDHAPWYIIPADDKENAHLIISQIIVDALSRLKLSYPKSDKQHEKELQLIYQALLDE